MFSKLSLLMAVMWCSAAEATGGHGHDVSQLCEDSARRFAADRVRAEEKVIALGVWCRKTSPKYDAAKCATAAAAVDLEALVFRIEGEVLLKECTKEAPEGEQRKAAVQNTEVEGDQPHLDVVLPVVAFLQAVFANINEYFASFEGFADMPPVEARLLLTRYNEAIQIINVMLTIINTRLNEMHNNIVL